MCCEQPDRISALQSVGGELVQRLACGANVAVGRPATGDQWKRPSPPWFVAMGIGQRQQLRDPRRVLEATIRIPDHHTERVQCAGDEIGPINGSGDRQCLARREGALGRRGMVTASHRQPRQQP